MLSDFVDCQTSVVGPLRITIRSIVCLCAVLFFVFYTILLGFYMISPCFSIFSLSGPVWSGACDRYQIGKASLRYLILMAVEPSHGTNCGKDDGRVLLFYELKGQIAFFASPCLQSSILSFSFEKLCQTAAECVWLHWIYFILGS